MTRSPGARDARPGAPVSRAADPVRVAVVGHTNTGKTSLLRTLTRDVEFGEVSDRPAVTRSVEGKALLVNGRVVMELYDTPGLEDSGGLLDHLDETVAIAGTRRPDWPEVIERFLGSADARDRFAQEAMALRQVTRADMALYVIDARDRVLGKHRDELKILGRCARPVVPVLNFTASPEARTAEWRDHLARVNMHAVAEFDTVILDEHGERRLFEKMQSMLDARRDVFDALIRDRGDQRRRLVDSAARMVADMLLDVGGFVMLVPVGGEGGADTRAMTAMRQAVRDREQRCLRQLLELFRFREDDGRLEELSIFDGAWGLDLFSKAAMRQFGVRAGGAAAAGAMAGLAVDAIVGGVSGGAATATGAAIGALIATGRSFGRKIVARARGRSELRVDDRTLRLLAIRQLALMRALLRRGHAAMEPVTVDAAGATSDGIGAPAAAAAPTLERGLPAPLAEARSRPAWSSLSRAAGETGQGAAVVPMRPLTASAEEARDAAETELSTWLMRRLQDGESA
ncbi:MAG: GTPase/DUF3482 domain-containing protein [Planctomycetota bacterium]|jgi:GTPase Era involved in 16S rRNA processing